jgi:hypothetical protein
MSKRSSRTVVVSKAFKVVDLDTRNDLKDRRLLSLESDNHGDHDVQEINELDEESDVKF